MRAVDTYVLSVIIPMYNSGKYISSCVESVLAVEEYDDIEIILVDDGSTDDCGRIADEYASSHENIKVIHKLNGGASDARNAGLRSASGLYVFFMDSDDLVVSDQLSMVIGECRNNDYDCIMWDADLIDDNGLQISGNNEYFVHKGGDDSVVTGTEFMLKQLKSANDYPTLIWLGAYRREFLLSKELFFRAGIHHEDDLWVPQVMLTAGSVRYLPIKMYLYRSVPGSLSHPDPSVMPDYIESLLYIYPFLFGYVDSHVNDDEIRRIIKGNLSRKYLHWIFEYDFYRMGYGDKIDKKQLWKFSIRIRDKIRVLLLCLKVS